MDSGNRLSFGELRRDCVTVTENVVNPLGALNNVSTKKIVPSEETALSDKEQWQMLLWFWRHFVCGKVTTESWKPFYWLHEVNYRGSLCLVLLMLKNYGLALIYLNREAICQGHTFSRISWKEINCKDFLSMLQIQMTVCSLLHDFLHWGRIVNN